MLAAYVTVHAKTFLDRHRHAHFVRDRHTVLPHGKLASAGQAVLHQDARIGF